MESEHSEHQYLFDQIDEVLLGTDTEEAGEIGRKRLQTINQTRLVEKITAVVDPELASSLEILYAPSSDGRQDLGEDINAHIDDLLNMPGLPDEDAGRLEYLSVINDIIWEASLVALEEDRFIPMYSKTDVQIDVFEEPAFDLDLKRKLIGILDEVMPGASIDIDDPNSIAEALLRRHT